MDFLALLTKMKYQTFGTNGCVLKGTCTITVLASTSLQSYELVNV